MLHVLPDVPGLDGPARPRLLLLHSPVGSEWPEGRRAVQPVKQLVHWVPIAPALERTEMPVSGLRAEPELEVLS